MSERDFCYWLTGFFEIQDASNQTNSGELNRSQVKIIRDHLNLVFNKVTPNYIGLKPTNSEIDLLGTTFYNSGTTQKYC